MHTLRLVPGQSIAAALATVPKTEAVKIYFSSGVWKEKLDIDHQDVVFVADAPGASIITWDDHNGTVRDNRVMGTGDSATVTVRCNRFVAKGMAFVNGFNYLQAQGDGDAAVKSGRQAVAFRTAAGSKKVVCEECSFLGWQDTLMCDVGRHYFEDCRICGNIDFIFGAGDALFEKCVIISRYSGNEGYVCAPSTKTDDHLGFCFIRCTLVKESDETMPDSCVWLGRPWHPSGATDVTSAAAFIRCNMDGHIIPDGWTTMHSRTKDGISRTWTPQESRFFEYASHGQGAAHKELKKLPLRRQMTLRQALGMRKDFFAAFGR